MINIIIPTCPGNEDLLERCIKSIINNTKTEYKLTIVKNNFKGFAYAINQALKDADDDVVLLNDDAVVLEGWEYSFLSKLLEGDIIGINGYRRPEHIPFWAVYIKLNVITSIGLLDETFKVGEYEDVDYCIRALEKGFKLAETDDRLILHRHPSRTISRLTDEQKRTKDNNKNIFYKKWEGTKWLEQIEVRSKDDG